MLISVRGRGVGGACEKCVGGCLKGKGVEGVGGGNRGSFYVQRVHT